MTDAATTLAILGASGDLTSRLLLPALGELLEEQPERQVRVVGAGRTELSAEAWRRAVRKGIRSGGDADASGLASTAWVVADITSRADMQKVIAAAQGTLVLYFAVPPAVAARSCAALRPGDLPPGTILALEKPFGDDEASAHALNEVLRRLVPENQIYRADHFLGRSTVLNVLGIRFANRVLEPVWTADDVESVVIRYDETLGLEGRAEYYDKAGAMIDMIQSHLLQVLAVVAMEPPASLGEADFRASTTAVLRATHIWDDNPAHSSHRARYTAGTIAGAQLGDYAAQPGVDPARETETLAQLVFEVRNARWTGVPFTVRSGKALGDPVREIEIRFKPVRHLPVGFTGVDEGAVLRFSLGPDTVSLEVNLNGGPDPFALRRDTFAAELGAGAQRAYAEVLSGILDSDALLSVRGDAAEEMWRIVQPVRDAWARGEVPLEEYPAGSQGPEGWDPPA